VGTGRLLRIRSEGFKKTGVPKKGQLGFDYLSAGELVSHGILKRGVQHATSTVMAKSDPECLHPDLGGRDHAVFGREEHNPPEYAIGKNGTRCQKSGAPLPKSRCLSIPVNGQAVYGTLDNYGNRVAAYGNSRGRAAMVPCSPAAVSCTVWVIPCRRPI